MKNNFDLKGYMKENKVGSYQQLNEMWYQDINQALGDFNVIKEEAIEETPLHPDTEEDENGNTYFTEDEMEEGKKKLAFVIPCPDAYDIEEEAEHFQYLLDKAGVKAKVKANQVGEEAEVYTKDEKKARKVIEKNGYQIGWNDDIEDNGEGESTQSDDQEQSHYLDIPTGPDKGWKNEDDLKEMGGVKTVGDKGKMATPNSRPNLGRHRSSDMLDKMSKKDHKTNTVVGAKAAAYKAPHMKEEETADDIFAGSDDANWKDNYGNETSEWDTNIAGQTVEGWTAEESQAGSISWQNPKYPHTIVYATPGWEGVNGIALEVYSDPEDGWNGPLGPMMQKVIGAHTDIWKTEKGYLALMDKVFTALETRLTPSEEMAEDDGTGRQINHDFNDDISIDPSEFEDAIQEDEDPFSSIKGGIDKITMGDDDMDMSDDDRFDQLGGDKIKAGIESLMADGFDFREILQFVKDTIASKRNY